MGPKVKHVYRSSLSANNRKSLSLFIKDSSKEKDNSLLQSLTSSTVRAQQEQVQKMQTDLKIRERKILQDITNLSKVPLHKPFKTTEISNTNTNMLPDDINERLALDEVPSFVASPIIFKETSFSAEDSFVFFEKSYNNSKLTEFPRALVQVELEDDPIESLVRAPISSSSSPNKVPAPSDIPTSDSVNIFEYYEGEMHNVEADWSMENKSNESTEAFASPISDKSISRISPEIEFFTIDPDFLASFEGIWHRKLEQPVQVLNPDSPDHFEQIPMISRGARDKKNKRPPPHFKYNQK